MIATNRPDLLVLPKVQLSAQSLTATLRNGFAICTPGHIFVVPEEAMGTVLVANVFTRYFPGQDIRGGVEALLEKAQCVEEIEEALRDILGDPQLDTWFALDDLEKFSITTWWFHMVSLKRRGRSVNRLVIKGKPNKEAFKRFYAARLGLAA